MAIVSMSRLALELRETNRRLRSCLESAGASSNAAGSKLRVPTAGEISALLSELLRAGEWLRRRPDSTDPALEFELTQYREQVERLRTLLPLMHRSLLDERARLEQEQERLSTAAHWARVSRQTL
jgi:hypothetical protein